MVDFDGLLVYLLRQRNTMQRPYLSLHKTRRFAVDRGRVIILD